MLIKSKSNTKRKREKLVDFSEVNVKMTSNVTMHSRHKFKN